MKSSMNKQKSHNLEFPEINMEIFNNLNMEICYEK